MRFPTKVPKYMPSVLGNIPVQMVGDLKDKDGDELVGMYNSPVRTILLRKGLAPKALQATLWHEWIHSVMMDAGLQLKSKQEEAVCDAIGTALAAHFTR